MEPVKYRGVAFEFGDEIKIVPPLNTRELEQFGEQLDKVGKPNAYTMKTIATFLKNNIVPLVFSVLKRNYPEFTEEQSVDFVNSDNWGNLVAALLGNSTSPRTRVGEKFPEVLPGSPTSALPSNSLTSIGSGTEPASPAALDGPQVSSLKM